MKIFISHSSKDKKYGEALVQLLQDIAIPPNNIIFTSKSGYGIPKGQNIFQWLKSRLKEKSFVIYLLSDRYYSSIPCLNEMGATWVIENDHIAMFAPDFEINNQKFFEGAIDPREIGVFMNKEQDIIEFTELIMDIMGIKTRQVVVHQAISKYLRTIDNIISDIVEEKPVYREKCSNNGSPCISNNTYNDDSIIEHKEVDELITDTTFFYDIQKGKLSDEELLLIKYMRDTGKITLGDRWMAEQEIENITTWEDINKLDNKLSNSYNEALRKLKIRNYVIVNSMTSYGNPREYILIEGISKYILNLPDNILEILDDAINKHLKRKRYIL